MEHNFLYYHTVEHRTVHISWNMDLSLFSLYRKLTLLLPFSEFLCLSTPLLVIMVQNWSWAHHWPIFSRKVLSALSVHRNCNNGSFLLHFYNHWISVSMSRGIKSKELSCSFRPLPKYYEKIPRTCLIAEVRHEMGSPFRYRYLPPTNRHIMQLYICVNMTWDSKLWGGIDASVTYGDFLLV